MTKESRLDGEGRVGPKVPARGVRAVCSSQHPIVTDTMLETMRAGGNAVDAAIAGCLVQATVQQEATNHAGAITCLYWHAATGETFDLDATGTVVAGLPPFRPVPRGKGPYSLWGAGPMAVIPGFMPGLKAMHARFATRPWAELCEPAIRWAEEGHVVNSFEHRLLAQNSGFYLYTASGRTHFTPRGHLPQVGDRWRKPELAKTLRALALEGPDCFINGSWARSFVERADQIGWKIGLPDMAAASPAWGVGLRYEHRGHEIVHLSPPQVQGAFANLVLGILDELHVSDLGHYAESAEALYYVAHTLRRAEQEIGWINDPRIFDDPTEALMSPEFHAHVADILRRSRPKADLTEHVKLAWGSRVMANDGPPAGSCEMSLVDAEGNWLQLMTSLQGGGLPAEVVGGVPMYGSAAMTTLSAPFSAWFAGGGRMRSIIGNTLVFRDSQPIWSLGTPGTPHLLVPQVLLNRLHYCMDPYDSEDAPRMLPLTDDYRLPIESRLDRNVAREMAKLGILVDPLPKYDYTMGSSQMCWIDEDESMWSSAGPRRAGSAAGF